MLLDSIVATARAETGLFFVRPPQPLHPIPLECYLRKLLKTHRGGGSDFETDFGPLLLKIDDFAVYDFYYKGFRQLMVKNKIFFGGNPPFGPP